MQQRKPRRLRLQQLSGQLAAQQGLGWPRASPRRRQSTSSHTPMARLSHCSSIRQIHARSHEDPGGSQVSAPASRTGIRSCSRASEHGTATTLPRRERPRPNATAHAQSCPSSGRQTRHRVEDGEQTFTSPAWRHHGSAKGVGRRCRSQASRHSIQALQRYFASRGLSPADAETVKRGHSNTLAADVTDLIFVARYADCGASTTALCRLEVWMRSGDRGKRHARCSTDLSWLPEVRKGE